jgi:hypothetical protein
MSSSTVFKPARSHPSAVDRATRCIVSILIRRGRMIAHRVLRASVCAIAMGTLMHRCAELRGRVLRTWSFSRRFRRATAARYDSGQRMSSHTYVDIRHLGTVHRISTTKPASCIGTLPWTNRSPPEAADPAEWRANLEAVQ